MIIRQQCAILSNEAGNGTVWKYSRSISSLIKVYHLFHMT